VKRLWPTALLIVVALAILIDPYTFLESASDEMMPAPWPQTALALLDFALVVVGCVFIWRGMPGRALGAIVGEAVYNIAVVSAQVWRDRTRFLMGADSHQYLSVYLFAIALRFLSIPLILRLAPRLGTGAVGSRTVLSGGSGP
jgi:hypothetical protein